jgi:hypothetical protein
MIRAIRRLLGKPDVGSSSSITVPIMDSTLRPNSALDTAETVQDVAAADNAVAHGGRLYFSSGATLLSLEPGSVRAVEVDRLPATISALAVSPKGLVVAATEDRKIRTRTLGADAGWQEIQPLSDPPNVTAMKYSGDDLYLCVGSVRHTPSEWKRDLMELGRSGSVHCLKAGSAKAEKLAGGLAYPAGIDFLPDGRPLVAEAWKHRLLTLERGTVKPSLTDLPGYPGRVEAASPGSYLVCVFAPRSQMIEFVLRERAFCEEMIRSIDEQYWMAPSLRAGEYFKEPVQGGGIRHLGIQKPWGPTRSYGLVIRVAEGRRITESFHSRADGIRHGMTSVARWNDRFIATSKGDGALIVLPLRETVS